MIGSVEQPRIINILPVYHLLKGQNICGLSWSANNVKFGAEPCELSVFCYNADGAQIDGYVIPVPGEVVGQWAEIGDTAIDDFLLSSNSNYKLQTQ